MKYYDEVWYSYEPESSTIDIYNEDPRVLPKEFVTEEIDPKRYRLTYTKYKGTPLVEIKDPRFLSWLMMTTDDHLLKACLLRLE